MSDTTCPACNDAELQWDEDAGWECFECGEQVPGDEDGPDIVAWEERHA